MKRPAMLKLLVALLILGMSSEPLDALAAQPLLTNGDAAAPYIGVWEPMYQGTKSTEDFAKWLNRRALFPTVTQYVFDEAGWPAIANKFWVDPSWGKWVGAAPGSKAVVFISLPTDGESLQSRAAGSENDKAIEFTRYLVAQNLGDSIICMGLINAPNAWDSASAADATHFVQGWRQVVTAMRSVHGAEKLQFDWVGMNRRSRFPIESAYPGDAYVDFVGMIVFDQCLDKSIYPIPSSASDEERVERQKKAWMQYYYPASQNGLEAWMNIAVAHHKPFSIPLWCLYSDHYENGTLSTGEDNSYFIQQMYDFIQEPAHHVYFASYMDIYYDCTKLMSPKGYVTNYPKAAALFQHLFRLAATTQAAK